MAEYKIAKELLNSVHRDASATQLPEGRSGHIQDDKGQSHIVHPPPTLLKFAFQFFLIDKNCLYPSKVGRSVGAGD